MDTLRLNNLFFIFFVSFILTSCLNKSEEYIRDKKTCDCIDTIYFKSDVIILPKELVKYKNGIEIDHIRKGIVTQLKYRFKDFDSRWVVFDEPKNLLRTDSLKITFSNKKDKVFILHRFISIPVYGGKKFIGCGTNYCTINEQDSCDIKEFIWL